MTTTPPRGRRDGDGRGTRNDLRARAREMRAAGLTYDRIRDDLEVSKSSISLWVRDLPRPQPRPGAREKSLAAARRGREAALRRREIERLQAKHAAAMAVGGLSERELFLLGVALYWAEGSKDKPYERREHLKFVNSDPDVIRCHLSWLRLLGVTDDRLRFTVNIHESADVPSAERFWARVVGGGPERFNRTVLKRHRPTTSRRNTGEQHRGCLAVYVSRSADLYRRVEGAWYGIVVGARSAD